MPYGQGVAGQIDSHAASHATAAYMLETCNVADESVEADEEETQIGKAVMLRIDQLSSHWPSVVHHLPHC